MHRDSNVIVKQRRQHTQAITAVYRTMESLTIKCSNFLLLIISHVNKSVFLGVVNE